jgi:hypothetical protein
MTFYSPLDRTTTTRAVASQAPISSPVSVVMPPPLVAVEAVHLILALAVVVTVVATTTHSPSALVEAGNLFDGRWGWNAVSFGALGMDWFFSPNYIMALMIAQHLTVVVPRKKLMIGMA